MDAEKIFPVFSQLHEAERPEAPPTSNRLPNPAGLFVVPAGTTEPEQEEQEEVSLVEALIRIANALERVRKVQR